MKNRNAGMWRRSEKVPGWFRAVLHAIMYSEARKAHSMISAIDRMLKSDADERVLIVLCAMGLEQSMIAEFLGISRFSLRRRKRMSFDFVAATETAGDLSPLLVCFAAVHISLVYTRPRGLDCDNEIMYIIPPFNAE